MHHEPVMVNECIEGLAIKPSGYYIDATYGRGGHSQNILCQLNADGRLLVIDQDPEAIEDAENKFKNNDQVTIQHSSFSYLQNIVKEHDWLKKVNGILIDLGVSSPQLDNSERGFSFQHDGPLDMRMDPSSGIPASEWIASAEEKEIIHVLKFYGEERFAKRIAAAIVRERAIKPIATTVQLANIIQEASPSREVGKHPATRSFQAIRIFINGEMDALTSVLEQSLEVLALEGRLVVIGFHSLEDRVVKQFMAKESSGDPYPSDLPIQAKDIKHRLKVIKKKIRPSKTEVQENRRARSAILRVAEKISD